MAAAGQNTIERFMSLGLVNVHFPNSTGRERYCLCCGARGTDSHMSGPRHRNNMEYWQEYDVETRLCYVFEKFGGYEESREDIFKLFQGTEYEQACADAWEVTTKKHQKYQLWWKSQEAVREEKAATYAR